jgi:hypothetical protein
LNEYASQISILYSIIEADFDKKIALYLGNYYQMQDYTITFVDNKHGKDNYARMLKIFNIDSKFLFSPFSSNKLYTLNSKFAENQFSKLKYFYDISLDTSVVSYIGRYQDKKIIDGPTKEIVKKLGKHRYYASTVNFSPYINENCLFSKVITSTQSDTIYNFFYYLNKFHYRFHFQAKFKSKQSTTKLLKNQAMLSESPIEDRLRHQYKIMHSILLIICSQVFKTGTIKQKILMILDFMANEIKAVDLCLLEIAAVYFEKKQNLAFFGKIQKGNKEILTDIKNLTWDVFHLRHQEFLLGVEPVKGIDVNLVLFCTLDKRLIELKDIIKLKAIAYNKKTLNHYPFYDFENVKKMLTQDEMYNYFQIDKHIDRVSSKVTIDYDRLIADLENKVYEFYAEHTPKNKSKAS